MEYLKVFDKALKEVKGGVLQLSSLACRSVSALAPSEVFQLKSASCPLPASSVISSHLATSALPARMLERNFYSEASIALSNSSTLQLELRAGVPPIPQLRPLGFVKTAVFQPDQVWLRSSIVWSKHAEDARLAALLSFLKLSGRCLLLQVANIRLFRLILHILLNFRILKIASSSCSPTQT